MACGEAPFCSTTSTRSVGTSRWGTHTHARTHAHTHTHKLRTANKSEQKQSKKAMGEASPGTAEQSSAAFGPLKSVQVVGQRICGQFKFEIRSSPDYNKSLEETVFPNCLGHSVHPLLSARPPPPTPTHTAGSHAAQTPWLVFNKSQ